MADQEHFTVGTINGVDVTIPEKQMLGLRIYGATPGQALIVDPGGFVKGGVPASSSSFNNPVVLASTASLPDYPSVDQVSVNQTVYGPGKNLGNFAWTVTHGFNATVNSYTRGITQTYSGTLTKYAAGDAANYFYVFADGGALAPADEGVSGLSCQSVQNPNYFHGTISATTGTGDVQPALASTSGRNATTDGGILLNISKGTLLGSLNGASSTFSGPGFVIASVPTTGISLPISTAYGVLSSALPYQTTSADVGTSTTVVVALQAIGASTPAFVVGGHIWIVGAQRIEQSFITAISAPSGGLQSITFKYRYPNTSAIILQGGTAGMYISLDANLAFSGVRSSYPAIGSLDGSTLLYAAYVTGSPGPRFIANGFGNEAATSSGANAGFHLYPGAEVAANLSPNANPKLEPNSVPWATSDVVECPFPGYFGGAGIRLTKIQNSPTDAGFGSPGISVALQGPGITFGMVGLSYTNSNPNTNYALYGGPVSPPAFAEVKGHWGQGIVFDRTPIRGMLDCAGVDSQQTSVNWLSYQGGKRVFFDTNTYRTTIDGDAAIGGTLYTGYQVNVGQTLGNGTGILTKDATGLLTLTPYGVTQNVPIGGSTLHITNGLITSVTTP